MEVRAIEFNPRYSVTDTGIVLGYHGRPMKTSRANSAHRLVKLVTPGKKFGDSKYTRVHAVHQLVVDAFIGKRPFPKAEIRHLNDVATDNRIENLKWGTRSENLLDRVRNGINPDRKGRCNGHSKLTDDDVIDIRLLRKMGAQQPEIARAFGIHQVQVSTICLGKQWKHVKEGL